ncbi:hypothetical protein DFJ43DRAFT_1194019 [Lentinula guzmanii]|uniref:Uncharacterized protein n=1 Tax=Lentinula guzmanii TaxID=2804957 RepID=A0AA38JG59_9AGAR|nr:hypothetical protein DFJ43DRAFT_1194019 [Lentinula guzmanii]
MLPRLSSHRIVCACLFLVTSLLVTVVAGPLIAKPDQWERRTSATPSELYTRTIQVIRIGFQKPGSETYENIKEISRSSYDGLRLTIFFGSTGFQPRIITHKETNTTELDSEIVIVKAPRRPASAGKEIGNVNYNQMMDIGPESSKFLWCNFLATTRRTQAVDIMTNVERLKDATNELLQTRAGVKAGDKGAYPKMQSNMKGKISDSVLLDELRLIHYTRSDAALSIPTIQTGRFRSLVGSERRMYRSRRVDISSVWDSAGHGQAKGSDSEFGTGNAELDEVGDGGSLSNEGRG